MLKRLGVAGKAVLIDVAPDDNLARSVRNMPGVALVASGRVTARDVDARAERRASATQARRLEKLPGGDWQHEDLPTSSAGR